MGPELEILLFNMIEEKKDKRILPYSNLDLAMLTTDSVWGKSEVNIDLREKLSKYFVKVDENGKQIITQESLWGLLGFYTRDMRLANLTANAWNNELEYVEYHLNLANDLLQEGYIESFLVALSRVATKLELSQSKGGFLRRNINTFRQESSHQELEPPKKKLFGGKPKQQ